MLKRITAKDLLASSRHYVPVDATWYVPGMGRDGYQEYLDQRIPGAVYFDVDGIKSPNSPYPHMMPNATQFANAVSRLGLAREDRLVVYDKQSYLSAPRALWMLKTFDHPEAYLLDNWAEYLKLGGTVESGPINVPRPPAEYIVPESHGNWLNYEDVHDLAVSGKLTEDFLVLDARPAGRFSGSVPEPRPGLPSGHIPGSINLPFGEVLKDGHFKTPEEVRSLLVDRGASTSKPVIVLCGSGVTACVIKTAVDEALNTDAQVYDGSWTEWAQRAEPELIVKDH